MIIKIPKLSKKDSVGPKIASEILKEIKKANNILLHLHPSPDPDSFGSTLGLYHALTSIGKKVTLIKGDSDQKETNIRFPGLEVIANKNIFEVDIKTYDLFLILDSSEPSQVSKLGDVVDLLKNTKTIYIDHHPTNKSIGFMNLVLPLHTSTSEIIFDLLNLWKIDITPDIATCLYLGIFSDSGGFCNLNTTSAAIYKASLLSTKVSNLPQLMFEYQNSFSQSEIEFIKLGLNKNNTYFSNKVAISAITLKDLDKAKINVESVKKVLLSETLRRCKDWVITISMVETKKNYNTISMRSRTPDLDMTRVAKIFSGGGHKVAAGAMIPQTPNKALKSLIETISEMFPELGKP